jgi:ubiquinone/menaquinone biosynthesis C-methylase UbiE
MSASNKQHWENIYQTKSPDQLSWTLAFPKTSLELIDSFRLPRTARILDIGGGDSKLVDHLLAKGFEDITVLDISAHALEKAKKRLGDKAQKIKWVVTDVLKFQPGSNYDLWHDRATFHFLTSAKQVSRYVRILEDSGAGCLVIASFSTKGPKSCSGFDIRSYSAETLPAAIGSGFEKMKCICEDHTTPFDTKQNFLFCSFKKRGIRK